MKRYFKKGGCNFCYGFSIELNIVHLVLYMKSKNIGHYNNAIDVFQRLFAAIFLGYQFILQIKTTNAGMRVVCMLYF